MSNIKIPDNFIGSEFSTHAGGVLTVTGKQAGKYLCECSICSKDTELFPEAFKCYRGNLKKGRVLCGCSLSPKWSKEQWQVKVLRVCLKCNYTFLGFCKWKGKDTRVKLLCNKDDHFWDTTSITNFIRRGGGCIKCANLIAKVRNLKSEEDYSELFMNTGSFLEGTLFSKKGTYWEVYCPVCSEDEYVKAGVCNGVFKSYATNLGRGIRPCRCSPTHAWTQKQREYQINKVCKEEGFHFIGLEEETPLSKDRTFLWECDKGHLCRNKITNFLLKGNRCKTCWSSRRGYNGFYKERAKEPDTLYILDLVDSLKVGRTFKLENRLSDIKRSAKLKVKVRVLHLFTADHQTIYDTEQAILEALRSKGFQFECDWTNECFTKGCLTILHELLNTYVDKGILERVYNV